MSFIRVHKITLIVFTILVVIKQNKDNILLNLSHGEIHAVLSLFENRKLNSNKWTMVNTRTF